MISNARYWFLLFLIVLVYVAGMFVTLFENDSAQFAVMAMRMAQENDFLNLIKGPIQYLDKPHMHFWLAALSYKIFGIHDWAYRIPAILATFVGAYSCYGLGKLLYNRDTGKLAALIFMTAQTIVLANIDVRTDAVLTAFTIFSIWHLAVYAERKSLLHIILGAFGAGIAFSTKGQIALLVIGLTLICHLAYTRKWKVLLNWRVLAGLLVFAITIVPMLYAYYHQFDLHPDKVIRGTTGRSGILFILWEQSFERLTGEGMGTNSSDYFFFFHTFLWVFLPWTVIGIMALGSRIRTFYKSRLKYKPEYEFLTLGGIILAFLIISFAQFKLPHYLNILIPLFAVLTASYLNSLYLRGKIKTVKILLGVQYFILAVIFVACSLLCFYVFKVKNPYAYILMVLAVVLIMYYSLKRENSYLKVITISLCGSLLLNAVLNLHFYPHLLKYQAGSHMAEIVAEQGIPVENIYKVSEDHTWGLDFYNKKPVLISDFDKIRNKKDIWLYLSEPDLQKLREQGYDWDQQFSAAQFRISRLQVKFLNPATRKKVLGKMHLVHIY